jgi:hypothetical protein
VRTAARDPDDWPTVALALTLGLPVWSGQGPHRRRPHRPYYRRPARSAPPAGWSRVAPLATARASQEIGPRQDVIAGRSRAEPCAKPCSRLGRSSPIQPSSGARNPHFQGQITLRAGDHNPRVGGSSPSSGITKGVPIRRLRVWCEHGHFRGQRGAATIWPPSGGRPRAQPGMPAPRAPHAADQGARARRRPARPPHGAPAAHRRRRRRRKRTTRRLDARQPRPADGDRSQAHETRSHGSSWRCGRISRAVWQACLRSSRDALTERRGRAHEFARVTAIRRGAVAAIDDGRGHGRHCGLREG